jgi:hypothetical protein
MDQPERPRGNFKMNLNFRRNGTTPRRRRSPAASPHREIQTQNSASQRSDPTERRVPTSQRQYLRRTHSPAA